MPEEPLGKPELLQEKSKPRHDKTKAHQGEAGADPSEERALRRQIARTSAL